MGRYFNRGRGNVVLTLSGGRSVSIPGNKWFDLEGSDETQASVMRAVRKGLLYRQPVAPVEEKKPAASAAQVSAPASEVKNSAAPAEEETQEATAATSSKPRSAAFARKS